MEFNITINDATKEELMALLGGSIPKLETPVSIASFETETTPVSIASFETETVDKLGLTWDARIHSDPVKVNKDGSFKKRRGLEDATFIAVRDEQLGTPVAPIVAPVAPQTVNTINSFLVRVQQAFGKKQITMEYTTELVQRINSTLGVNFSQITDFTGNQVAIDTACNLMTSDGI